MNDLEKKRQKIGEGSSKVVKSKKRPTLERWSSSTDATENKSKSNIEVDVDEKQRSFDRLAAKQSQPPAILNGELTAEQI